MKERIRFFLFDFLSWGVIFISPTFKFIMAIGFFVIVDFITGLIAAKKIQEPITSKKMRPTIGKFVAYGLGIIVAYIIEILFFPDFPSLKLIAGLMAWIELKSMNENFEKITGHNIFKIVLEKMHVK